jgi:hypothetical protein
MVDGCPPVDGGLLVVGYWLLGRDFFVVWVKEQTTTPPTPPSTGGDKQPTTINKEQRTKNQQPTTNNPSMLAKIAELPQRRDRGEFPPKIHRLRG